MPKGQYKHPRKLQKHGHARSTGMSPEYHSWSSMKTRCHNKRAPDYPKYGGRGIRVCARWRRFLNFLEDMGPRPAGTSLDRYPNKGGNYEPNNCRWATSSEQNSNKRNNAYVTHNGQTLTVSEWGRVTGILKGTIRNRLVRGWSVSEALDTRDRVSRNSRTYRRRKTESVV